MKKILLSLAVVLGMGAVAQAADVTLPGADKKWNAYTWTQAGDDYTGTVEGYTLTLAKGTSSNTLVAPDQYSIRVYAGANLTVTAPAGTTFKQVVVKGAANSKATNATATGWTVSCSGAAGATFVATFTSETPQSSITFDGAGKQLRVGSITLSSEAGGTVDPDPTPDPTPDPSVTEYDSFAKLAAAGSGAEGKVNGPVYFIYANATGTDVQVKDSKGGYMLVYRPASVPAGLVNGDAFAYVQGKYSPYNNLPEVASATFGDVTKGGAAVAPEEPGLDEISAAMANTYVKLSGVSISGLSGKSFTITDADGNTVKGYNTFNLDAIPEGENQTIVGFVRVFKTDVQIAPVTIDGGVVVPVVETPVFSVAAGAVEKGTEVTISCATEGATIHYTTDGSFVSATSPVYSEPIVINEAMTIKAIAVKEGMTDSKLAQAAYTIKTETPVGPTTGTTATFTFSDPSTLTPAYTLDQAVDDGTTGNKKIDVLGVEFVANGAKIATTGTGNAPRLYYQTTQEAWTYRVYKNTVMTMTAPEGYKFVSIVFDPQTTTYANQLAAANVFSAGTYDSANKTLNFAGDAAVSEVTFTPAATTGFNSITYNFSKTDAVNDIIAEDADAPAVYYNMQGVRVANPAAGNLYIKVQGSKATKVLVK